MKKVNPNFKLVLCDFTGKLCEEFKQAFAEHPEVEIRFGRFEDVDFDCVVSPGNSFGLMDGGIDEAITMHFGQQMMDRVQETILQEFAGEQPVGTSVIVRGTEDISANRIKFVAHTPTMIIPSLIANTSNIYMAMKAMLLAVQNHNDILNRYGNGEPNKLKINTVVCPGLGTGAGRVPYAKAANDMAKAYNNVKYRPTHLSWPFATIRYQQILTQ